MAVKTTQKRLARGPEPKLFGVCSGIAAYFDLDAGIVRLGWIIATAFTGFVPGVIAYVIAALVIPEK